MNRGLYIHFMAVMLSVYPGVQLFDHYTNDAYDCFQLHSYLHPYHSEDLHKSKTISLAYLTRRISTRRISTRRILLDVSLLDVSLLDVSLLDVSLLDVSLLDVSLLKTYLY